jgi:hypothetical protein
MLRNVAQDLRTEVWKDLDWNHPDQNKDIIVGYCEHAKESPGSKKCREFLYYLSDIYLLKKDSAP